MNCKKCNKELEENMKFCPNCGASQEETQEEIKEVTEETKKEENQVEETVNEQKIGNQEKEKKHVFSWIVCVIMVLFAIFTTPVSIANLFFLLCGLISCPPLVKIFNAKTNNKVSRGLRIFIFIIVFIIGIISTPTNVNKTDLVNPSQNSTNTTQNKTNNTNQTKPTTQNKEEKVEKKEDKKVEKKKEKPAKSAKQEFKDSCKTYKYKDLARNPSKYIDKKMKFTGKVIQVSEGWFNSVTIRLNVTKDKYGFYDDTVYCTYTYKEGESKILEDDIITVWGTCKGDTTYTTVLGASVTIPKLEIEYVKIK